MKNLIIILAVFMVLTFKSSAQWVNIDIPGSSAGISSMFTYVDALMVGTLGDGIYTTSDNGSNWTDISGNIGNKNINDIRGGGAPQVIWVATESGIFYTQDHSTYSNNTSSGLSSTDVNYYWFGDNDNPDAEWAVGTNGGGLFVSPDMTGPWTAANSGISGNGLTINDLGGYDAGGSAYAVLATDGGVYFTTDHMATWMPKNSGLSGEALKVKKVTGLGTLVMIATRSGLYWSMDLGESWTTLIPAEKFNTTIIQMIGGSLIALAFGEHGYYSTDLITWNPVELPAFPSGTEVMTFALNSTHLFLGTQTEEKDGNTTGGIYKRPIDQVIVSIEDHQLADKGSNLQVINHPNPFNTSTTISYTLPATDYVSIKVYNVLGEEVQNIVNEYQYAGVHHIEFDASDISGTTFFYILQTTQGITQTGKMMKLR